MQPGTDPAPIPDGEPIELSVVMPCLNEADPVVVADEADPVVVAVDLAVVAHAVAVMLKSSSRAEKSIYRSRLFLEKGRFFCSRFVSFWGDFRILFLDH